MFLANLSKTHTESCSKLVRLNFYKDEYKFDDMICHTSHTSNMWMRSLIFSFYTVTCKSRKRSTYSVRLPHPPHLRIQHLFIIQHILMFKTSAMHSFMTKYWSTWSINLLFCWTRKECYSTSQSFKGYWCAIPAFLIID